MQKSFLMTGISCPVLPLYRLFLCLLRNAPGFLALKTCGIAEKKFRHSFEHLNFFKYGLEVFERVSHIQKHFLRLRKHADFFHEAMIAAKIAKGAYRNAGGSCLLDEHVRGKS